MSHERTSEREAIAEIVTLHDDIQQGLQHQSDALRAILAQIEQLSNDAVRLHEQDQVQKKLCKEMYDELRASGIDRDRLERLRRAMADAGII